MKFIWQFAGIFYRASLKNKEGVLFINLAKSMSIIGLAVFLLSTGLNAKSKTKVLSLFDREEFKKGLMKDVFLNNQKQLELAPQPKEILKLEDSIIWNSYKDDKFLLLGTGSEGMTYVYDNKFQLVRMIDLSEIGSTGDVTEVTAITRDSQGNFYFGTGSQGMIYRMSSDLEEVAEWLITGRQFIWDMQYRNGYLYYVTGGKEGGVFRVALGLSDSLSNSSGPLDQESVETLYLTEEPNVLKLKIAEEKIYFSTSDKGKLYRMNLDELTDKKIKAVEILFDGGDKDIPDFVLIDGDIYLATSGRGTLDSKETKNDYFKNYIAKINSLGQMEIIYHFNNQNISQLVYFKKNDRPYILVGMLEDAKIYLMSTDDFPELEMIHYNEGVKLSSMFYFKDRYYLTSANSGVVFEMITDYERMGFLESKVIDMKQTVQWGKIHYDHYGSVKEAKVIFRVGNTKKVMPGWSKWISQDFQDSQEENDQLVLRSRYIQFKVQLYRVDGQTPVVSDLKMYYSYQNLPHRIISLKFDKGFNGSGGIPPDKISEYPLYGVFKKDGGQALEYIKSGSVRGNSQNNLLPFADYEISDIFSMSWNVINPDNDQLQFRIEYQEISDPTQDWKLLKEHYFPRIIYFDKKKFVDGKYLFRITADDYLVNGSSGYENETVSPIALIDNSDPVIKVTKKEVEWKEGKEMLKIYFNVVDKMSRIKSVRYSYDRKVLNQLIPRDGIFDEMREEFSITIPREKLSRKMILYAEDDSNNLVYQVVD